MSRRRWWMHGATVLGCVALLAGCGIDVGGGNAPVGGGPSQSADQLGSGSVAPDADAVRSVVMIGDSITKGSRDALEADLGGSGFDDVLIEAENGKRMAVSMPDNPSGAAVAAFIAGEEEGGSEHADEIWIVALGTNDVGNYSRPEEIAGAVNEVLAAVPDESPLVWVDVYLPRRPELAAQFNAIMSERIGRRGNSVVAPWSAFGGADGVLSDDDVHPTTDGTVVFASVVAETVRSFLGR